MKNKNTKLFTLFIPAFISLLVIFCFPIISIASTSSTFNQAITGTLDVAIVDAGGSTVSNPSVAFSGKTFSVTEQTSTGTLGVSAQRIRVTNPTSTASWSLTIAATGGNTATWSDGSNTMDFNNTAANGRMTIDSLVGTLAGVGSTSTSNISKGSSASFNQGVIDSITLLTASSSAAAPGQWDFTGPAVTQDIPALQATGNYSISMTLTVS
jgi:hypothetical protein